MEIKEIIHGVCPSKSNSYRIGHNGMYKSKALTDYESKFFIQCKNRNKMISTYFELDMQVYYPSERSDLDNSLKIVLDCMQKAKLIKNDNKCVKIVVQKFLDKDRPRVEFSLRLA